MSLEALRAVLCRAVAVLRCAACGVACSDVPRRVVPRLSFADSVSRIRSRGVGLAEWGADSVSREAPRAVLCRAVACCAVRCRSVLCCALPFRAVLRAAPRAALCIDVFWMKH